MRWLTRTLVDTDISALTAEFVGRYQPIADAVLPFYLELQNESRNARYPRTDELRAWSVTPF